MRKSEWLMCLVAAVALCLPAPSLAEDLATIDVGGAAVRWDVQGDFEKMVLTVSQPNGNVVRREFKAGQSVAFELDAAARDGVYRYELRGVPRIDASVRRELLAARKAGNESLVIERLREAGKLPREESVQSGAFSVKDGAIVERDVQERPQTAAGTNGPPVITAEDQVIPDDLIVQGSGCFGFDCVNNESFGFDTIRLKENNLRIKFDDTSVGTYPANDWQLTANDSASGGASKFSIEDITGSKVPFTITAGASTNSIFVDSTGRVGLRTSTPVLDLHINTSNTPAIRLEQNNSGGFTAQTWDIGANEANFFVRDVTGGSKLSFRIRPGAPTSSLDISADGDVGIGTGSPTAKLHVAGSNGSTKLLVKETSGTTAPREMFEVTNNGGTLFIMSDSSVPGTRWSFGTTGSTFFIDDQADGAQEVTLQPNGTLTVFDLIETSDRNAKTDIFAVRPEDILQKVNRLPLATWRFKEGTATHLGPMAQDFSALFGLGDDDTHIKALDVAGVSLAAVQGLNRVVEEKDKEITELKGRIEALEKLVHSLAPEKVAAGPQ